MKFFIDQYVLSKVEKSTQFLQKYHDIKLTSITCFFAIVYALCICMRWYYVGTPSAVPLTLQIAMLLYCLFYVFVLAEHDQADAEKRAENGVSNPYKVFNSIILIRVLQIFFVLLDITVLYHYDVDVVRLINLFFSVSFLGYLYTISVDVLPPSKNKEESWIKNLFRKRSLAP